MGVNTLCVTTRPNLLLQLCYGGGLGVNLLAAGALFQMQVVLAQRGKRKEGEIGRKASAPSLLELSEASDSVCALEGVRAAGEPWPRAPRGPGPATGKEALAPQS